MRTLASVWAEFRERVVPPTAGLVQVQECRRAFYAGAEAYFHLLNAASSDPGPDATDEDVARVEALRQEILAFAEDVAKGRA